MKKGNQKNFIFGYFFVDYIWNYVKIAICLTLNKHKPPAGDRYNGEPHVFVSADTRQKAPSSLFPNVVVGDPDYSLTI